MQNGKKPDHQAELILLHIEAHKTHCVSRPPLPVAQIYPMDKLQAQLHVKPQRKDAPAAKRGSMFFKGAHKGIEKDPFLQRLSRLH